MTEYEKLRLAHMNKNFEAFEEILKLSLSYQSHFKKIEKEFGKEDLIDTLNNIKSKVYIRIYTKGE